jgi:hypothetical protein
MQTVYLREEERECNGMKRVSIADAVKFQEVLYCPALRIRDAVVT